MRQNARIWPGFLFYVILSARAFALLKFDGAHEPQEFRQIASAAWRCARSPMVKRCRCCFLSRRLRSQFRLGRSCPKNHSQ